MRKLGHPETVYFSSVRAIRWRWDGRFGNSTFWRARDLWNLAAV
jgi:hypothetical protein